MTACGSSDGLGDHQDGRSEHEDDLRRQDGPDEHPNDLDEHPDDPPIDPIPNPLEGGIPTDDGYNRSADTIRANIGTEKPVVRITGFEKNLKDTLTEV
jgi:hypothetical protein